MVNLLRFVPETGQSAYTLYGEAVVPLVQRAGGRVLWHGTAEFVVIGQAEADGWDYVIVVEYPSRQAFLDMISSPEYRAIDDRRSQALVDSRLIACTEQFRDRS